MSSYSGWEIRDANSAQERKQWSTPPRSQKNKVVALRLTLPDGSYYTHILSINPDDLQLNIPSRSRVTQTEGGAYLDNWGIGVGQGMLQGNTGWRYHQRISGRVFDGLGAFKDLYEKIYLKYYEQSQLAADPDTVKLRLIDNVDDLVLEINPDDFRLLRNKNKPLLFQYQMPFTVIEDILHLPPRTAIKTQDNIASASQDQAANRARSDQVAAASRAANPTPKRTHTVKKGDTLWAIAKQYYGQGTLWTKIYEANKKPDGPISNPNLIYPGWSLVIP